ncbi:MAG: translation initiation factor IF-3 [Patescibacteria group bacterium]|nr:translation initiation factor IF-3 [Patescibacteria group bacterium]
MRRKWQRAKPKEDKKKFWANRQIRVPEVFLIDENGETVGNVSTAKALAMAEEAGLDLVEVNPKLSPPVAKIVDLGQLKYEVEKKEHKQKIMQKKIDTKGIRLSIRISQHDFDFRLAQAKKFLGKGDKLKIDLVLKGREKQHPEKAREVIMDFVKKLEETEGLNVFAEQGLTKQGGRFNIILVNKNN